jgi:hypothetical protein
MSAIAPPRPSTVRQETRPARRAREDSALLGRYTGPDLRAREIVSVPAMGASTLVIDRDIITHLDDRLSPSATAGASQRRTGRQLHPVSMSRARGCDDA